ncbi:FtsH protease activity modulator HflK [Lysobacter humi (ex Lee et al. 2017)]
MAWNTPGSDNGDRGRTPRRRGFGPQDVFDRLRGLVDGSGGPARWIPIVIGLWLVFSSFVLVAEQERAVVLRLGAYARTLNPGPHLKAPWPIEKVEKVNATRIETFTDNVPVLTADENIVQVEINVQYRISDPVLYRFGTRDAVAVLEQASLSAVRELVGRSKLDNVLGSRNAIAVAARDRLQRSLDAYRTGLAVTELNLPNARPPEAVKPAFDDVNSAQQDKDRVISEARAYAAKIVPEARGAAAGIRATAEGYKTAKVASATGDAQRFTLLVEQYKNAPDVTRKRLWLETVQDVLAQNRTIVGGDSRQLIYVPMAPQAGAAQAAPSGAGAPLITPEMLPSVTATEAESRGRTPRQPRGEETGR